MECSRRLLRHHVLPNELVHSILTICIAESSHLNCVAPINSSWNTHCISTLASVSFSFREIVTKTVMQAFRITESDDGESVLQIAQDIIHFMRLSGGDEAIFNTAKRLNSSHTFSSIPLVHVYGIYAAVANLRNHLPKSPRELHENIYLFSRGVLIRGLALCKMVRPTEIPSMIMSALEDECLLNEHARSIVQKSRLLDMLISEFEDLREDEDLLVKENIDAIMTNIHEALLLVETCNLGIDNLCRPNVHRFSPLWAPHELSGVKDAIRRLGRTDMNTDVYDVHSRASLLLKEWNTDSAVST